MTFDEWWEDFVAEHDDWKYADSEALRRAAFQAGAASRDAEIARLKTVPMRYRRMAFNAQLQNEVAELVAALERMRVAGGSQEFYIAWELAKDVLDKVRKP